ncbi:MAG: thioredoxin-dependent thiol peroxidase [Bacteroidetes bacterium]|nr:MAG: thioredoxin-dependent thiol peroxidase [Bacteroidota bacterium]
MTHLKIGDKAPDFQSVDQEGNPVNLKDFAGKKVILYFYPRDNTPGCTVESCNLRDNYAGLMEKGYEVIGVSADTEKSHRRFIKLFKLPFTLLADTDKKVIEAYGIWGEKKFMGRTYDGIHRTTFVISEDGTIEDIITKVKTKSHTAQILENAKNTETTIN